MPVQKQEADKPSPEEKETAPEKPERIIVKGSKQIISGRGGIVEITDLEVTKRQAHIPERP